MAGAGVGDAQSAGGAEVETDTADEAAAEAVNEVLTPLTSWASGLHETFEALVEAGFTRPQAMQLLVAGTSAGWFDQTNPLDTSTEVDDGSDEP